jgi:hypothetical protein
MSEEVVLAVLKEVLDELKEANKSLKEMDGKVKELETRVGETTVGMSKVATMVKALPSPIVWRISMFPENDRQGSYKTFIRWVIGGIVVAFMVESGYVLLHEWVQHEYPREMPAAASGTNLGVPPGPSPSPVLLPVRKAGEGGFRKSTKKVKKIIDTLNLNIIRREIDSLRGN